MPNSTFFGFSGKHNIANVNLPKAYLFLRESPLDSASQGGSLRVRNLDCIAGSSFLSGRGSAFSISIPAAISSARNSIISSTNSMSCLRKLAMRFNRVSLNSASCPLFNVRAYSTNRRSLSSAVSGFRMGDSIREQKIGTATRRQVRGLREPGEVKHKPLILSSTRGTAITEFIADYA